MACLAHAHATAIEVVAGSKSFELTAKDVNRHPDSLLHSLLNSVETGNEGAPVKLDLSSALSSSQLGRFKKAAAFTVALYRHKRLPVDLLSDATKFYNSGDLLDKLQQLLDFLNLPGPISKYLPKKDTIPLRCMGVLDLHVQAAAQRTVDLMLGSSMSASDASTLQAAFFCVHVNEEVSKHFEPVVYSLNGDTFLQWPKGSSADFAAGYHVRAAQVRTSSSGDGITGSNSSSSNAGSIRYAAAQDMMRPFAAAAAEYGQPVNKGSHTMLSGRIDTVLRTVLAQVPCNGRTGVLQSCSFIASFGKHTSENSTSVWAVWW